MTPGSRLSSPMAMNRNDAPQITPIDVKIDQSRVVKAAEVVRGAGDERAARTSPPHLYTVRAPMRVGLTRRVRGARGAAPR